MKVSIKHVVLVKLPWWIFLTRCYEARRPPLKTGLHLLTEAQIKGHRRMELFPSHLHSCRPSSSVLLPQPSFVDIRTNFFRIPWWAPIQQPRQDLCICCPCFGLPNCCNFRPVPSGPTHSFWSNHLLCNSDCPGTRNSLASSLAKCWGCKYRWPHGTPLY